MKCRAQAQQEAALLALVAERDAAHIGAIEFHRWIEGYERNRLDSLRVDAFGRLTLSPKESSTQALICEDAVLPAWRHRPDGALFEIAQRGRAYRAFALSDSHAARSLGAIVGLARTATNLRRISVIDDALGEPMGAFTWLHISGRTLRRIRADAHTPLHASEWNEGRLLWIRDLACREPLPDAMIDAIAGKILAMGGRAMMTSTKPDEGGFALSHPRCKCERHLMLWLREQLRSSHVAA